MRRWNSAMVMSAMGSASRVAAQAGKGDLALGGRALADLLEDRRHASDQRRRAFRELALHQRLKRLVGELLSLAVLEREHARGTEHDAVARLEIDVARLEGP